MIIRAALLMLACCCVLPGQSTETYTSFLLQVARLGNGGNAVLLNGEPSDLVSPRLQDEVGLGANEAEVLKSVAKDFQSRMATMDLALRSVTWERRMAAIAGENPKLSEAELQAQLTRQKAQLVTDAFRQLETRLGEAQFQAIRNFINSHKDSQFLPLRTGYPAVAK